MADGIEALEVLHGSAGDEFHFRYIGKAKERQFVVNVQFEATASATGERLEPQEFDFMICKILRLILDRIAETPNPALH